MVPGSTPSPSSKTWDGPHHADRQRLALALQLQRAALKIGPLDLGLYVSRLAYQALAGGGMGDEACAHVDRVSDGAKILHLFWIADGPYPGRVHADAQFLKAFEAGRQLGASKLTLHSLVGLANVTRARGRHVTAARMLGCADAANARAGFELHPADQPPRDRLEAALRASLGDAAYEELHAQGSRIDPDQMVITPEALEGAVS